MEKGNPEELFESKKSNLVNDKIYGVMVQWNLKSNGKMKNFIT